MDRQNGILGEGEEERGEGEGCGRGDVGGGEGRRGREGREERGRDMGRGRDVEEERGGGMIHRGQWTTTNRHLVTNKAICSRLWFEVPDHQTGVHGSSSCRQSQSSLTPSVFSLSSLPSCFILGLKETHVTASL